MTLTHRKQKCFFLPSIPWVCTSCRTFPSLSRYNHGNSRLHFFWNCFDAPIEECDYVFSQNHECQIRQLLELLVMGLGTRVDTLVSLLLRLLWNPKEESDICVLLSEFASHFSLLIFGWLCYIECKLCKPSTFLNQKTKRRVAFPGNGGCFRLCQQ